MSLYPKAADLIKRYEGFYGSAVQDPYGEEGVCVIGHGLNYYPDETPVTLGQRITKAKANEYLEEQLLTISTWLNYLKLDIDEHQEEALVSFIHSIGVESFEQSKMMVLLMDDKAIAASDEFSKWVFNDQGNVIGNMLCRRKEERCLYLQNLCEWDDFSTELLVECFSNYKGTETQDLAIHDLESQINPYVLANFLNTYNSKAAA
jgi:lysozyme